MTSPENLSDDELLRLARSGDEEAFAALYRRRANGVYRFALQMCGEEAAAQDVVQETFMALARDAAERYDPSQASLATYLYAIARNHVRRHFVKSQRFVAFDNEGDETESNAHEQFIAPDDPHDDFLRAETIEKVRAAILSLPEHYREVVALCELHELNYADAAVALGLPVGTIRSRLHRARALLVARLRDAERMVEKKREDAKALREYESKDFGATSLRVATGNL